MSPLGRAAHAIKALARDVREFRRSRRSATHTVLNLIYGGGVLETVRLHRDGTVAVEGWTRDVEQFRRGLAVEQQGTPGPPAHVFRTYRPDAGRDAEPFLGVVVEFVLEERADAVLVVDGRRRFPLAGDTAAPPYAPLRTAGDVYHRDGIYGSGPPATQVSAEVVALARTLPPPILDFGCGAGALVVALRRSGLEVYGLELDEPRIQAALLDEARPFVTLYRGDFPMPFADKSLASVVASEVIEHIPGYDAAVRDLARVARTTMLITVPDCSAIPRCAAHQVVPWHLLEATHLNFFTQHSLGRLVEPIAKGVEMARIGAVRCDRAVFYTSLAATVTLR